MWTVTARDHRRVTSRDNGSPNPSGNRSTNPSPNRYRTETGAPPVARTKGSTTMDIGNQTSRIRAFSDSGSVHVYIGPLSVDWWRGLRHRPTVHWDRFGNWRAE